jgi:hypothetical protein
MKTSIKANLDTLHLSDVYSLMLFVLYKVQEIPEYAILSELCYLLDGSNLNRLFTYFAGQTVTFPTKEEMSILTNALLLYQYVQVDGLTYPEGEAKLEGLKASEKKKVLDLYLKLLSIMANYNIDRAQVNKNDR